MSYSAKYQSSIKSNNSRGSSHNKETDKENINTSNPFKLKANGTRQSYIKAFKKYQIENLIDSKVAKIDAEICNISNDKKMFSFNHENSHFSQFNDDNKPKRSIMKVKQKQKPFKYLQHIEQDNKRHISKKISHSKITNFVKNNDIQLQQMLYNSIGQVQKQMLQKGDINDVTRQNKILKITISKLKVILKQKLQISLKKNKQELTIMFEEYSTMIKKLLEDKQHLTNQLQEYKHKVQQEEYKFMQMQEEYENKIRIIIQNNNDQISNTKLQIEQFLDMIVQYQQEASKQKLELQKMREKVIDLEMQNDNLKKQHIFYEDKVQQVDNLNDALEKYCDKIESLLSMIEHLQTQNQQLQLFLKNCQCSRICSKNTSDKSLNTDKNSQNLIKTYQKRLMQAQKELIKEQSYNRCVLKKKDECIDRLNLLIGQLRRNRYQSVDKMTDDTMMKNSRQSNMM